jgi:hypothetical protein
MRTHALPLRGSASRARHAIAMALLLSAAPGCGGGARSASFPLHEVIPFGPISVAVDGWEAVGEAHAPISWLRAPAGEKAIAVFVRWDGLEPYAEPDRQTFAKAFLRDALRVVDADGFGYQAISAMPRELYLFTGVGAPAPRDWVVVFHVYVDSRGYTLRLSHPDPDEEAFDVAIVQLG